MSRALTTATLLGIVVLLLTACSQPRKAGERACRKAERHLAKAVWLCPAVLEVDTTPRSATTVLPGDSATVALMLAHSLDVDSILAECEQLREVISAERDLYAATLAERHLKGDGGDGALIFKPSAERARAVQRLQAKACQFEPLEYDHELFSLTVTPGEQQPMITVRVKDRAATVQCPPCPPTVKLERTVLQGVAPGWKTFGQWVIGLFLVVVVVAGFIVVYVLKNHHA